jgi:dTDP-glucose 4,6-dehydratase
MRTGLRKILVTGGAGFIGSEFVRQAVKNGQKIIVVDKLTYAGDLARIKEVFSKIRFYKIDISNPKKLRDVFRKEKPQIVVHFAAETHVDRSIQDANPFIEANVRGTQNLIDLSRDFDVQKFIHISTDEIYGESKVGQKFREEDSIKAKNPYSASKASAELLVRAAIHTYRFPAIIVRPANNYGPWQYPEKFIPVIILKTLHGQKIPVYGQGKQIREWLFVGDCARAIHTIVKKGIIGEVYNIGSYFEKDNLTTAKTILKMLGKSEDNIQFVEDRLGHDFKYTVDCTKLKRLGWEPKVNFTDGMKHTISWYTDNVNWLEEKKKILQSYWNKVYKTK